MEAVPSLIALKNVVGVNSSSVIEMLGYYQPGDGGGGLFYWDENSTDNNNDGLVVQPTLITNAGRWKRIYESTINVRWFGSKGDNTTNDTLSFQLAIAEGLLLSGPLSKITILVPSGEYMLNQTITIDVSRMQFIGDGSTLNFTEIPHNSTALHLTGTTSDPWYQGNVVVSGFIIKKDSRDADENTVGLQCVTLGSSTNGTSHIAVRNISVYNFSTGLFLGSRCYASNFESLDIWSCDTCVYMPPIGGDVSSPDNTVDGGERMTFKGCAFYNSILAVNVQNDAANFVFDQCSFDYNNKQFYIRQTKVYLSECHVEAGPYLDYAIHVKETHYDNGILKSGDGGLFSAQQTLFLVTGNVDPAVNHGFIISGSGSAGVVITDCFMHNIPTSNGFFATGDGKVVMRNIKTYQTTNLPKLTSAKSNLLIDGSFELNDVFDNWFVNVDDAITNRLTGQNLQLSLSNSYANSGSKSLRIRKTQETFLGTCMLSVPISINSRLGLRLHYMKPCIGGGLINVNAYWATMSPRLAPLPSGSSTMPTEIIPGLRYAQNFTGTNISFTEGTAVAWTQLNLIGEPWLLAPEWADHLVLEVNMNLFNSSSGSPELYFDDIIVTQC